uniref:SWR1-complex protein 4 n=1 Tax=Ganoderma boninense TaxID=34458 RepID=A0A5K1JYC8_9APHY|nr:SWR1-complex protein 4 [Ganoderma boninense]
MAASAADVRSILSIPNPPAAGPSTQAKKPQAAERAKKPEGIPRELYALIGPTAPTLVTQFAKPRLKQKPNLGGAGRVRWHVKVDAGMASIQERGATRWTCAVALGED